MMYQIPVPDGVGPGQMFQANLGGAMVQVACPEGVEPGTLIQVQGPAMATGQPVSQVMNDADGGMARVLGPLGGLLIRQKLDAWEILLPAFEKRNKYKVAAKPTDHDDLPYDDWEDKMFKKALKKGHVMTMKEKSDCMARICCGSMREFKMKVKPGDDVQGVDDDEKMMEFERPFKCTIRACCCILMPQELTVNNNKGERIGKIVETFKCPGTLLCTGYWHIYGKDDDTLDYILENNMCKGCNMCGPSMCVKTRSLEVYSPDHTSVVGKLTNVWPGCSTRGCLGDADNFILDFPTDATVEQKATLLGASVLVDFMLFEKKQNDNNGIKIAF